MSYEVSVLGGFLLSTLVGVLVPFSMALAWQGGAAMKEAGAILLALALVGACAGTAGGMSRVGAVGSIVPAFLGLLGGLSIYLFGIDPADERTQRALAVETERTQQLEHGLQTEQQSCRG